MIEKTEELANAQDELASSYDYGEEGKVVDIPDREDDDDDDMPIKRNNSSSSSDTSSNSNKTSRTTQESEQAYLHDRMKEARKTNNKQLENWVLSERDKYGMDKYGKIIKKMDIKTYHTGIENGLIGGESLKPYEEFAKVAKGEAILNVPQMDNVNNALGILDSISSVNSTPTVMPNTTQSQVTLQIDKMLNVEGNLDKTVDTKSIINEAIDGTMTKLKGVLRQNGMTPKMRMV